MTALGPKYKKSLEYISECAKGIDDKNEIVRYRALEKLGLCKGVGLRVVSLTNAGRKALENGCF